MSQKSDLESVPHSTSVAMLQRSTYLPQGLHARVVREEACGAIGL